MNIWNKKYFSSYIRNYMIQISLRYVVICVICMAPTVNLTVVNNVFWLAMFIAKWQVAKDNALLDFILTSLFTSATFLTNLWSYI